jgi:hypothetical protein
MTNHAGDTSQLDPTRTVFLGLYLLVVPLVLLYFAIVLWPPPELHIGTGEDSTRTNGQVGNPGGELKPGAGSGGGATRTTTTTTSDATGAATTSGAGADRGPATQPGAPPRPSTTQPGNASPRSFATRIKYEGDIRLMLLVLVLGALGGYSHALASFVAYAGNRQLAGSWAWWYVLRGLIGSLIALALYLLVRGGFFSPSSSSPSGAPDVNVYGVAALAVLAGMFSKQASDKFCELFDTMFRTQSPDKLKDKLTKPPTLTALNPKSIPHGAGDTAVEGVGTGFVEGAQVLVDGTARAPTAPVEPARVRFTLQQSELAAQKDIKIAVQNPKPDGATSNVVVFKVT